MTNGSLRLPTRTPRSPTAAAAEGERDQHPRRSWGARWRRPASRGTLSARRRSSRCGWRRGGLAEGARRRSRERSARALLLHNTTLAGVGWQQKYLNLRRHGQGRQWCLRSSRQLDSLKKRAASYGRRFSEMAKQTKLVKWGSHKWSVHQVDGTTQTSNLQEYCRKSPEWPYSTCFMNKSKYPGRFRTCLSKFFEIDHKEKTCNFIQFIYRWKKNEKKQLLHKTIRPEV